MRRFSPGHLLSRLAGYCANSTHPLLSSALIRTFIRFYRVDLSEAELTLPGDYSSFNQFFTRALKADARPLNNEPGMIISPADGRINLLPKIVDGTLIQAKNRFYTVDKLLDDPAQAETYSNGGAFTVYLSPRDYHRVHMPLSGKPVATHYVPGSLFPVNRMATRRISSLFGRNERLICYFEGEDCRFALVFVAALIVGGIGTVWGTHCDNTAGNYCDYQLPDDESELISGAELGRFFLGSTVVVLFDRPIATELYQNKLESAVKMGQLIASLSSRT